MLVFAFINDDQKWVSEGRNTVGEVGSNSFRWSICFTIYLHFHNTYASSLAWGVWCLIINWLGHLKSLLRWECQFTIRQQTSSAKRKSIVTIQANYKTIWTQKEIWTPSSNNVPPYTHSLLIILSLRRWCQFTIRQ